MRVVNLILHIVILIIMLPDILFVTINTLMGLGYFSGVELIMVPIIAFTYAAAFASSTVGEIITFFRYRSARPKVYMRLEMIFFGLTALCFIIHIRYIIQLILHPAPKIPELSTESPDYGVPVVAIVGLVLSLAGMIFNLVMGIKRNKKTAAIAKVQATVQGAQSVPSASHPAFCSNCGNPAGISDNFCGNCGSKLVR